MASTFTPLFNEAFANGDLTPKSDGRSFVALGPSTAKASSVVESKSQSAQVPVKSELAPPPPSKCVHAAPIITTEKEGDGIVLIRVECTCGQVMELKCGY